MPLDKSLGLKRLLVYTNFLRKIWLDQQGRIQGGDWGDRPLQNLRKYDFIHHDFAQVGKQHKAIVPSIVLSQCCDVYFISLTVVNP